MNPKPLDQKSNTLANFTDYYKGAGLLIAYAILNASIFIPFFVLLNLSPLREDGRGLAKYKEMQRYQSTWSQLFIKPTAYADRDSNGIIDFNERAEAYNRMGYTVLEGSPFPEVTTNDLERAIESYKQEQ